MIRGIIVGMGNIAQTGHLPAYMDPSLSSLITIPAAVEPDPKSRAKAREHYPGIQLFDTLDECMERVRPDFVDICTPPYTHTAYIEALIPHHTHILCEKPFAIDEADARRLAAQLSADRRRVFMGCHQYRFSPVWKQFQEFRRTMKPDERFILHFDVYRTEADPGLHHDADLWRIEKNISGGGILADTGIHYLYLCYWLFGRPLSVTARTAALLYRTSSIEDTALVVLEYPNGMVSLNVTWAADRRLNGARIATRANSLSYDGTTLVWYDKGARTALDVPDAADKHTYIGMYASLFREFAAQISAAAQRPEWIDEAVQSVSILEACYLSAFNGKTVHMTE